MFINIAWFLSQIIYICRILLYILKFKIFELIPTIESLGLKFLRIYYNNLKFI